MTVDYRVEEQTSGERIYDHQGLFRYANRKILELRLPWTGEYELLCECASPSCFEVLRIEPEAYEAVCSEPLEFVVLPGHDDPDAEEVVRTTPRYFVIRHAGEQEGAR
jgi:hypothetical protein